VTETDTRDQILDAAERLFATRGFARATIKRIGQEAGVNSALLYYYFGDKEKLYRAVLERLVRGLVGRTVRGLDTEGAPQDRLRALVTVQAEVLGANPNFAKLLVRELTDYDARHAVEQIRLVASTTFRRLCDLIREGQASGAFRPDLDPRHAAISVIAQVAYFHIARPAVAILLDQSPDGPSPAVQREFARHAADFALAALRPVEPAATSLSRRAR